MNEVVSELDRIAIEIRSDYQTGIDVATRIRNNLIRARELVPHGEWTQWVEDNCPFTMRQAQRYLESARENKPLREITHKDYPTYKSDSESHLVLAQKPVKIETIIRQAKEVRKEKDRKFENYGRIIALTLDTFLLDDQTAEDMASIEQAAQHMTHDELELARKSLESLRKLSSRVDDWINRLAKALKEIEHE